MTKVNKIIALVSCLILIIFSYMENAPEFGAAVTVLGIILLMVETVEEEVNPRNTNRNKYTPKQ